MRGGRADEKSCGVRQTPRGRDREGCGVFIWLMREEGGRVRVWRVKHENR